ncbi:MAG: peptidylprolyl isomerase [Zetaproteobacteria bacterium]|nr:peptidylprolyl isomerase [Zetaproteobacteria bacterium]
MFQKTTQFIFYTLLIFTLNACQVSKPENTLTAQTHAMVLAKVGTHIITQEDVDAELRALPEQVQEHIQRASYQQYILTTLIQRAVLSQRAKDVGLDNNPSIRRRIEHDRDSIMIEALRNWKIKQLPPPQEITIQQYYQHHLSDFSIPEQVHARHILLHNKKQAAWVYHQLIHKKDSFENLAIHYSLDDSNKSRGGDLNWFPRGTMLPAFEKAVFALKKTGDISHPVHTKFGWHIIEILEHHPASQSSLQDVRDDIVQTLRQQKLDQWVDHLVKESRPEILGAKLPQPSNLLNIPINTPQL